MANAQRGEVDIVLGGKSRILRPSFQALAELENTAGCGLLEIARRFQLGVFGVQDMTFLLWAGLRGTEGDRAPSVDDVGRWTVQEGVAHHVETATLFLTYALGGFPADEKN